MDGRHGDGARARREHRGARPDRPRRRRPPLRGLGGSGPKDIGTITRTALQDVTSADDARRNATGAPRPHRHDRRERHGDACHSDRVRRRSLAEADAAARRDAALTHFDPAAGDASAALCAALRATAVDRDPLEAARAATQDARVRAALGDVGDEAAIRSPRGRTRMGRCAGRRSRSRCTRVAAARRLLPARSRFAISLGRDTDTNGAVTGALAGARGGAGSIPSRWLEALRERDRTRTGGEGGRRPRRHRPMSFSAALYGADHEELGQTAVESGVADHGDRDQPRPPREELPTHRSQRGRRRLSQRRRSDRPRRRRRPQRPRVERRGGRRRRTRHQRAAVPAVPRRVRRPLLGCARSGTGRDTATRRPKPRQPHSARRRRGRQRRARSGPRWATATSSSATGRSSRSAHAARTSSAGSR